MDQPAFHHTMDFAPALRLTKFLGTGYLSHGIAEGSLLSLLPIYPSQDLMQLAQLSRNQSLRTKQASERAGKSFDLEDEPCFHVIMFKKFGDNLPDGFTVDAFATFFTDLFTFDSPERKEIHRNSVIKLLTNAHYYILAISVSLLDPDTKKTSLLHCCIRSIHV